VDDERIIGEIEQLQEMFEAPDTRVAGASDLVAENRRHERSKLTARVFGYGSDERALPPRNLLSPSFHWKCGAASDIIISISSELDGCRSFL
jgi:hypothetical protein